MDMRIIDLTFPIYDRMPTFPYDPKTTVTKHLGLDDFHYNIHRLTFSSHLGTHMDAPYHFYDDGTTIDNVDLHRCLGPAVVIDLRSKGAKDSIQPDDLQLYEKDIQLCRRVILHTGWDKHFSERYYFTEQPVLTEESCTYLVSMGTICLAMDMPTTYPEKYIDTHLLLLKPGVDTVIIEGLCRLERLRSRQVLLLALPLSIQGCDGSPCRVVAIDGDVQTLLQDFAGLERMNGRNGFGEHSFA